MDTVDRQRIGQVIIAACAFHLFGDEPLARDDIRNIIDQMATEVGLGKHLYGWDGSELCIAFRADASKRVIGFNRASGMRDVLNWRPILAAAAASIPAHEHA